MAFDEFQEFFRGFVCGCYFCIVLRLCSLVVLIRRRIQFLLCSSNFRVFYNFPVEVAKFPQYIICLIISISECFVVCCRYYTIVVYIKTRWFYCF